LSVCTRIRNNTAGLQTVFATGELGQGFIVVGGISLVSVSI